MSKNLIIGMGEIGKAVTEVVGSAQTLDIEKKAIELPIEVLHICFPYTEHFKAEVRQYMSTYRPEHTIIWSTVPIGTCADIDSKIVHSPPEGVHPYLADSIYQMERWIGYNEKPECYYFVNYFQELGLRTKEVPSTYFTEALKLLSTTEYGINIEFARYKKTVADDLDMPYELMKEWNQSYNKLYKNLGMEKRFQKYVLDAPEGPKGGHCITPNARLLNEQYPSEFTKIVGEL